MQESVQRMSAKKQGRKYSKIGTKSNEQGQNLRKKAAWNQERKFANKVENNQAKVNKKGNEEVERKVEKKVARNKARTYA